jgi:hypothetical protein
MASTVKIGPSFFKKEFNDYSNWHWAYIREAFQNCIDAPQSNRIEVTLQTIPNEDPTKRYTRITFANNGKPMDMETIENKLLSLGETGKGFEGTIGGFGKAKVILYFAQQNYTIQTGNNKVTGEGGSYDITQTTETHNGTKSEVNLITECTAKLTTAIKDFAKYCQWDGLIILTHPDGSIETLKSQLNKGYYRRETNFGKIYTNTTHLNKIIVRIGGIPMFTEYTSCNKGIIVELQGPSGDILTSNRDSLNYQYSGQLRDFILSLSTDSRRALSSDTITYTTIPGLKYSVTHELPQQEIQHIQYNPEREQAALAGMSEVHITDLTPFTAALTGTITLEEQQEVAPQTLATAIRMIGETSTTDGTFKLPPRTTRDKFNPLRRNFVIKNCTALTIPEIYNPYSHQFSSYALKLAKYWGNTLDGVYRAVGLTGSFSIGFIFDQEAEAQYEKRQGEITYYINPVCIERDHTGTRMSKRFKLTERNRLISIAVHEVVHLTNSYHDEEYANRLTDYVAKILGYNFSKCFTS